MERLLKDYSYYLRMERAMSQSTVASYCSDVSAFLSHFNSSVDKLVYENIEEYLLSRDLLTKRSLSRVISSLRSFCGWLVLEGVLKENPCDRVDGPKLGRYLPEVLSVEEVVSIIEAVDVSTWAGLRNRALLEVLYSCGLRVSEAVNLRLSSVFFKEGYVRILGKGNKERLVPMGEVAAEALKEYLAARPGTGELADGDIVFVNRYGNSMSRISAFNIVKKAALVAGVRKDISPHTFRHSFATHLIENGADIRMVQEMLGHESVSTTEIYTHIDTSTWHGSILEHHPRRS